MGIQIYTYIKWTNRDPIFKKMKIVDAIKFKNLTFVILTVCIYLWSNVILYIICNLNTPEPQL